MAKLTITWDQNAETDLAGYTIRVNDGEEVDVGRPSVNAEGKVEHVTDDFEPMGGENTVEVRAYDTSRNISSPAVYTFDPPPAKPEGLAVFFVG